jgi:hypothetical protein
MGSFMAKTDWASVLALLLLAAAAVEATRMASRSYRVKSSHHSDLYIRLRERALRMEPPVDSSRFSGHNAPFALVTDVGYAAGTATILTTTGGDASIYFSRDGSYVRGYGNPSIAAPARWSVEIAGESITHFRPSDRFPIAREGEVLFYLISADGVQSARISLESIGSHAGAFTNLFAAVKRVLLSFRANGVATTEGLR